MRVNGRTRLAGVVGWPLSHTLSPAMHNAAYARMGLDWVYLPLPVADEDALAKLVDAVRVLPFVGFNVTMPYKRAVLEMCDEVAMLAQMAGAVNTVHVVDGRLIGYNTDARGLLESLELDAGFSPEGRRVVLVGAGGAAAAALVAFVLGKAGEVTVVNRTRERAEDLVERMRPHLRGVNVDAYGTDEAQSFVRSADLIVNATPVGMAEGDPSPVPVEWLRPGQVVADMIYRPAITPLLEGARRAGARAVGGLGMLVSQGATAIDIWSDSSSQAHAPRDVMRSAAEEALGDWTRAEESDS